MSGAQALPLLETERLRFREARPDDLGELAAIVADPEQMRFFPRPKSRTETSDWIARQRAFQREHGMSFWPMELVPGGQFAGYCGIRPLELDGVQEIEIGWRVRKELWNQGLATEAARAVLELAFGRFGLSRVTAIIVPEHAASRRVAEKVGMREERRTTFEGDAVVVYAVGPGRAAVI